MKTKLGLLAIGVIVGLAATLAAWRLLGGGYRYQGSLIDPPVPAADFTLTDQNGQPFRLSEQTGKVTLVFFGYTNCPDVCPITLSNFKQVKKILGKAAEQVNFVFVTVDPERDTPQRLKEHMANYDPTFIALTGSPEELGAVWKNYGVYVEKVDSGSAAGYLVDHTAIVYAIDKAGNWRLTYPFGMEVEKMAADVSHLVREK